MQLSLRKNGLASLFKEVRVFTVVFGAPTVAWVLLANYSADKKKPNTLMCLNLLAKAMS